MGLGMEAVVALKKDLRQARKELARAKRTLVTRVERMEETPNIANERSRDVQADLVDKQLRSVCEMEALLLSLWTQRE